jgi:hypothetical protein
MKRSNRRKFIGAAAVLCAGSAISGSAIAAPVTASPAVAGMSLPGQDKRPPLAHHVFFTLKNAASIEDRDKLVEGVRTLAKIETVRELHVGILADTERRDVVNTGWQVSELMFFSDLAGQATYQNHPVHLEFIKNYSHLWEKVVVYDAMEV